MTMRSNPLGDTFAVPRSACLDADGRRSWESAPIAATSGRECLDEAAREAVLASTCSPYLENGIAYRVTAKVPITFNLNDSRAWAMQTYGFFHVWQQGDLVTRGIALRLVSMSASLICMPLAGSGSVRRRERQIRVLPNPQQVFSRWRMLLAGLALAAVNHVALAHDMGNMPGMRHDASTGNSECTGIALNCASVATPFIDKQDKLWLAWSASGAVSVASSDDGGRRFSAPVVIGRYGDRLDASVEARPQLAVDSKGRVVVAYSVFKDENWNAEVLVSTSADGKTFSPARSLSRDSASQRFPVIAFDANGTLFAAWIDKRTVAEARRRGLDQPGAAIAYAWSRDAGRTFVGEAVGEDHTCECCRLDAAVDGWGDPVVLFRKIYGTNERDHAVLTFADDHLPVRARRVSVDHWHIDGCPHQGPALAVSSDGTWHAAWYTGGDARQGLFYARSTDEGRSFSDPQPVGDASRQAGRPSLLARGASVWLAWKEFDGKRILARVRHSNDGGRTWSEDRTVGTAQGYADRPLLVGDDKHVYLSWLTREHRYQAIELNP